MGKLSTFLIITWCFLIGCLSDLRVEAIRCEDIAEGGWLTEDCVIRNNMLIKNNLYIDRDSQLTVNPGVTVRFAPSVMLAVNGTLRAEGTDEERIKFTYDPDATGDVPEWPQDIRLVDEWSVNFGRLQLLYQGKWRGVCANSVNWTQADVDVACNQLGFKNGSFSFLSWSRNDTDFMLYYDPQCEGSESSVLDCPNSKNIQIGHKICVQQQTVHLHCDGIAPSNPASNFWWGMEFYNSTYKVVRDGPIQINESASTLVNVDIEYAGMNPVGEPVPALRASPRAPHLIGVSIKNCALDGTNFTDIKASTVVHNSVMSNNRGHGLVIETNLGRVEITDSKMSDNRGNGVKTKFLDGKYAIFDEFLTFCQRVNIIGADVFPITITGIPNDFSSCGKRFQTNDYHKITVSFVEMDIEPEASATLEIYDFFEADPSKLMQRIDIMNGTLPSGLTTTDKYIYIHFSWTLPPNKRCPTLFDCVKFTIVLDRHKEVMPEFYMNNTEVSNNTQHGVFVENVRNYVIVNASDVTGNKYGAGIRVYGGAGDVLVNASHVDRNLDNGVNITYDGGLRIFNMSTFSYNMGNGINITLNETSVDNRTRYTNKQITEVSKSEFVQNDGFGVRVGNYCRSHEDEIAKTAPDQIVKNKVAVNDSYFIENMADGVNLESCFRIIPEANLTNFTVAYNRFDGNHGHGIRINPLINAVGRISNNTFINHMRHSLLIDNTDDFLKSQQYSILPVHYEIEGNHFYHNEGFYVANVRLTQGSTKQSCNFRYNHFTDNSIRGRNSQLNERTKAYSVVIISSSNVNFIRNQLENPNSVYELATQLLDKSTTLACTRQWWGTTDYKLVIPKIFDQFNRYNLARIDYHPALRVNDLYTDIVTDDQPAIEIEFVRGDYLGGRLARQFSTTPGKTYIVDRDISVISDGKFIVKPGTKLEFHNALGLYVEGEVNFEGQENNKIEMYLTEEEAVVNHTSVRLVDGPDMLEGRLEIRPEGKEEWGTVCNKGWTIVDASVACQMLGLVVHPSDWFVFANIPGPNSMPIWRSSVDCTDLDMDIMECAADSRMDHSCNHTDDVYIKCKPLTWAGIQFAAKATPSRMVHTSISYAGLMDPAAIFFSPAIKIAYNTHTLEHLIIENNMADGLEIMKNDVFSNAKLAHSVVRNNFGNGVSTRTSYFEVYFCTLQDNTKAGFEYNPHYTTYEAQQIRFGIHDPIVFDEDQRIDIVNDGRRFVVTKQKFVREERMYVMEFHVENLHRVNMDIIDYNPDTVTENVTVYQSEAGNIGPSTNSWTLEDDLVDFPITSDGTVLTVTWRVAGMSSGRFAFVIRSARYNLGWPFGLVRVTNTTTEGNKNGIICRHYNQPSDEFYDLFFRYRWETINMYGVTFKNNIEEALWVPSITKYNELYLPTYEELQIPEKVAEIHYELESNLFTQNGGGVLGEHNHVEFSNNVWIWEVSQNHFEKNYDGGFMIELPKVNLMYTELYNHSVNINGTVFHDNNNFAFRVDGFYCNSSIVSNTWSNNKCKLGCITIAGTEKDFEMTDNKIYDNVGKYIMEFNMQSHTPYTRWVDAQMQYNDIKRNRPQDTTAVRSISSTPNSYAFGVKGLQNITINRNLFDNFMEYELIGGQSSSSLENYLDVTENYWGTTDQEQIRDRIFDFENWNSYAIAEYYPYLLSDDFNGLLSTGGKLNPGFDPTRNLGGRIEEDVVLPMRDEPYVVERDLTVMPDATLLIEPGVELQFYPNIGILVLGRLSAVGKENNRIKFNPIQKTDITYHRKKRAVPIEVLNAAPVDTDGMQVRLIGGETEYDGWIEIYNATERRWAMVCDDNFNDRTAEVACKTMGKEWTNVRVTNHRYYDIYVLGYPKMHEQVIEWFWRRSFICDGSEGDLDQCRYKQNYHLYRCMEARDYVYVRCGPRNLADNYDHWGNLRFSTPEFEHGTLGDDSAFVSFLDYADIYGAGILHEERVAAIQSVYRVPTTEHVSISHCNWNGYDYIAPRAEYTVAYNNIENNNGYAVGGLVLNGESRYDVPQSSFDPLVESAIPYNVYGLVHMCSTEKLVYVKHRLLLYYKYVFNTVDCIKVLRSSEPQKQVALRFLQLNMYNDSFYENSVEMYDGEYFDPHWFIGKVDANTSDYYRSIKYETSREFDTMGIRITASPAFGDYGFIAEVVTLPFTPDWRPDLGPGLRQTITGCSISNNEGGGFMFMNAGELNPSLIIEQNRITDNGLAMLNITSPPIMDLYVQNTRLLTLSNNYIAYNHGSVDIETTTSSLSNALYANVTNNFIAYNTHGEVLHIEGHYFQGFNIRDNYIGFNYPEHRNVIAMFGISLNFTTNIVFNNTARCILNASMPELVGTSLSQRYLDNSIYNNWAYAENRSTIFLKSAKFTFQGNYLINRDNRYEMVMFNRTKKPDGTYPQVNAANNWWGGDVESFVGGRIWERRDDDNLIEVNFQPFYTTNASVLSGKCDPGWRGYENKCYWYFGGVVDYATADKHCRILEGRLAKARDRDWERAYSEMVIQYQENYDENFWYTWVYSENQKSSYCTSLRNSRIRHIDCSEMHPFLCEKDPFPTVNIYWRPIIIALGCTGGMFIIILICCWFSAVKSRQRQQEKVSRRSTMKRGLAASKASLFSSSRPGTSAGLLQQDVQQKRRRPPISNAGEDPDFFDITGATMDATSTDSIDKLKYMDSHRPMTPASGLDYDSSKLGSSSYLDSDLGPVRQQRPQYPRHVENEITSYNPNRSYDQSFRNEGYDDDMSVARRNKSASSMNYNPQKRYSGGADVGGVSYSNYPDSFSESSYAPSASGYGESNVGYPAYSNRPYLTSTGGASGYSAPKRPQEHQAYVKPPRPRPKESAM